MSVRNNFTRYKKKNKRRFKLQEYFSSLPQISLVLTVCVTVFFIVLMFILSAKFGWLSNLHIGKDGIILSGSNEFKKLAQGNELKEIKEMIAKDREDWKLRIEGFDKELSVIKSETASIKTDVQNISRILVDHEEYQEKISEGTLENMLFNDNVSIFKRLKAYKRLIAMGKNGKIRAKGFKLILDNKEVWEAVQEADLKLNIVSKEYFDSVMNDINTNIFRY
jgi:hypothetical protein